MSISLRIGTVADIPAIQSLAHRVWHAHYPSVVSVAQIEYMLEMMYSDHSLAKQLQEEKHSFLLAEETGALLGFASYEEEAQKLKIHKLYVDQQRKGQGIGKALIEGCIHTAPQAKDVTLNVNRMNISAINFYFRNGFSIQSCADRDIGNGFVMNDFVMIRVLS